MSDRDVTGAWRALERAGLERALAYLTPTQRDHLTSLLIVDFNVLFRAVELADLSRPETAKLMQLLNTREYNSIWVRAPGGHTRVNLSTATTEGLRQLRWRLTTASMAPPEERIYTTPWARQLLDLELERRERHGPTTST